MQQQKQCTQTTDLAANQCGDDRQNCCFNFFFWYIRYIHIYYLVTAKSCKYVFMLHTLRFMCVGGQCPRCRSRRSRLLRSSAAALVSQGWGKLCLHDFVGAQYFGRFIAIVIERKGKIFTTWKVRNFAQHFSALKNIFFGFNKARYIQMNIYCTLNTFNNAYTLRIITRFSKYVYLYSTTYDTFS